MTQTTIKKIMEFLFEVAELSVPLVQEIVWLSELKYDVLDCLKPPYYFIPKGSVPIENHAGHNLATHAKLENPKWLGVPHETLGKTVKHLIQKVLNQSVVLTRFSDQILYSLQSDQHFLQEQNERYGWNYDWTYKDKKWKGCTFNEQNRLTRFDCSYNTEIKDLDVTQCSQLQQLYCWNNRFKELDVTTCTQLQELWCSFTQLRELDVSQCTQLQDLSCSDTRITILDVSSCIQLQSLNCSRSPIGELHLGRCIQLQQLFCSNTQIKELDLSQCTQLQALDCYKTHIKELDLGQCNQLHILDCEDTQIEELDVSQCSQLQELYCNKTVKINKN
jgi:Leucine-rich repeat (LRR) protein